MRTGVVGKPLNNKGSDPMPAAPVLRRTVVVELVPTKEQDEKLRELGDSCSKLWNQANYERRRQFFSGSGVDIKGTYAKWYNEYKGLIGSATAQEVLRKNNEAWMSFFGLLRAKKEGKLPPFIEKVDAPGYWKSGRKRKLIIVLRKDQYKIDEERREIYLRVLGKLSRMRIKYKGEIYYRGEQGRLEIIYNPVLKKWYAHISFKASERLDRRRGEWRKIPSTPKGNLIAGIDLGVNNLFAVYVSNGTQILVKTRVLKSISYYYQRLISARQKALALYRQPFSNRIRRLYIKWKRRINAIMNAAVRKAVEHLYEMGVSSIKVGYPKNIGQGGNFLTANVWSYGQVINKLKNVAEEYGIRVELVGEAHTSSVCPIHGKGCGRRITRGLFKCATLNKAFNADLVGAYNISIIPSPGDGGAEGPAARGIGIIGDKAVPLIYAPTRRAGLALKAPASCEPVRVKRVDHKPMSRPKDPRL